MRVAAGLMLLPLALLPAVPARPAAAKQPGSTPPTRYLILCVDGVGYSLVAEMHRRGQLPHFQPPSELLVAFPTLTDPALVEILRPLGAPPSRGYEDYYFDPRENRMRGGFFHRFRRRDFIAGTFRELFDYHTHPAVMTAEYALPVLGAWLAGHISLGRIFKKFERSREPYYLAYVDSTDPLAHLSGERFVRGLLQRLDRNIPRLRRQAGGPVEVIVFSDHGNHVRRYRRAPLERALKRHRFRLQKRLQGPRSVVFPKYGLVGSAVLYTPPGLEAEVAEALREAEGVALVAYRDGAGTVVENSAGRARILRQGDRYAYRPETGDPLGLAATLQQLAAAGKLDAEGFASAADWGQATAEHLYPDPLRRLWLGFEENVAQPASVLVSLKDGYYTGSRLLDLLAFLQATHGNLGREQSQAFVLSTGPTLPPFLRGDQFWEAMERLQATSPSPRPWETSLLELLPAYAAPPASP